MTKKWNKPTRKEARVVIQFWLLEVMTLIGFIETYQSIFLFLGFPLEWWTLVIAAICGILSTWGLIRWIGGN